MLLLVRLMVSASSCARASQRIPRRRDQIDHYPEYVSQHAPTLHPSQKSQRLAERAAFLLNLIVMTTHKRRQLHARQRLTAYHAPLEIGRHRGILIGGDHEATGLNKERGPLGILLGIEGGREGGREEGGRERYLPAFLATGLLLLEAALGYEGGGRKERRKRGKEKEREGEYVACSSMRFFISSFSIPSSLSGQGRYWPLPRSSFIKCGCISLPAT